MPVHIFPISLEFFPRPLLLLGKIIGYHLQKMLWKPEERAHHMVFDVTETKLLVFG